MYCPKCGGAVANGLTYCPTCGAMQVSAAPQQPAAAPAYAAAPAQAYPAQITWDYATWGTRALGYIIDAVLVGAGMAVLYLIIGGMFASMMHFAGGGYASGTICCTMILLFPLATLIIGLYNSVYLVAQRGYSIGQGVVKVMVVDGNGKLLTQGAAMIRLLVRVVLGFVPFLPLLDLLWPLWDVRRQTLHDKAVNCYVINMR